MIIGPRSYPAKNPLKEPKIVRNEGGEGEAKWYTHVEWESKETGYASLDTHGHPATEAELLDLRELAQRFEVPKHDIGGSWHMYYLVPIEHVEALGAALRLIGERIISRVTATSSKP